MDGQKSLINIFWASVTLIYILLVCALVYIWANEEMEIRRAEFNQIRDTYITSQKELIKTQVNQAAAYIQHKRSLAEKRVKKEVQNRTREAFRTAMHLWEKNRDHLSREEIETLVHDALYAAVWDEGKGYYFAEDMEGVEKVNRNNPNLEGTNIMDLQDSGGKYIMREILAVAKSPEGEGFCTYHWNRPGAPGILVPKISYVKYFKPLDWVIGNGKYIIDEEEKIKSEVLGYIEDIRYGNGGYLFAGTLKGISLSGPFKGKNTLDVTDPDGVKIVSELIRAAESGGGFVTYVAPKFKGLPPKSKISYAQEIPGWDWYIGTGVHVDAVETVILKKQADLKKATRSLLIKSTILLGLFLVVSCLMAWLMSKKIKNNLDLFINFFNRSASQHLPLEKDQVSFVEFQALAGAANQMVRERNESEAALRMSEKKYRQLFEKSKDAILILENEIFVDCNQAAVDMLGYKTKSEFLNNHPAELSPRVQKDGTDSLSKVKSMISIALEKGNHRFEWDHIRANGDIFPVEVLFTLILSAPGKLVLHTTWRDITDRKKAEAMMIHSEKMITVGGLAAGMAHEINNPLAGMMQNAQLIHNRMVTSLPANEKAAKAVGVDLSDIQAYMRKREIPKFLSAIHETGNRAAKIVQNMLNFTRKKPSEKSPGNLALILDETVELTINDYNLKKNQGFNQIKIIREYMPNLPRVLCDDSHIQQVFFNILNNAAQAMAGPEKKDNGPAITLRIGSEEKFARVEIEDNGPGMDENLCKRIFEPFFTTKPVNKGTGLGLAVSYFIIVDDHGGTLDVESTPGRGTKFIVRLPLAEKPG